MEMEVSERVHIMPVGYEHDRVVESAKKFKADQVLLIGHKGNTTKGERYWKKVQETLDEEGIDYESESSCDIFDLYDSIGTIASLISNHRNDDVYVNISTGSKVTAVAGTIAANVADVTAYYAKAESYDGEPGGISEVFELPHYPIQAPDQQQVKTLHILHLLETRGIEPTKGQFIHVAEQNNLDFTTRDVTEKGKYRLLDDQVLKPLSNFGYVDVTKDGRERIIHLTDKGQGAYQAFKALIDTESLEANLGTLDDFKQTTGWNVGSIRSDFE